MLHRRCRARLGLIVCFSCFFKFCAATMLSAASVPFLLLLGWLKGERGGGGGGGDSCQ